MVNGYEAKVRGRGWRGLEGYGRWRVGSVRLCHCPLLGQVYGASNVELITRTRTEHLSDQHKGKSKGGAGAGWAGWALRRLQPSPTPPPSPAGSKTPLQSFLGIAEQHVGPNNGVSVPRLRGRRPPLRPRPLHPAGLSRRR